MFDDLPVKLCQDNGEIFFRDSDIERFQRVFDTVVDNSQHLLVTSHFDGVIDHYGKMMLNRLKMRSGLAVETYMPASTEALVTRFNELVDSMSVEEARGESESGAPGRIIMVNDPKAIDSDGWALLSRMVTDFPGLNMRLVFLLDRLPTAVEKALDRLGSRLIRWEVEPPTPDEQLALRKAGMAEGLEFQVERVLSRINQTVSQHLEPSLSADEVSMSLQVDLDDALGITSEAGEREADDMRALFEEEESTQKRGKLGPVLLIMIVVIGGTIMAGFVSPEIGQKIDRGLRLVGFETSIFTRKDRGQSVIEAAYDPSVQTTPQLPSPEEVEASQSPPPPVGDGLTDEQAARKELATEIAQSTNITAEAVQQLTDTPNRLDTEGQTQSLDLATETEQTVTSRPFREEPTASASDVTAGDPTFKDPAVELVKNAPSQNQFVQHIVLASKVRAEAWITTQTGLTEAVVVPVRVNGNIRYAVVSGPFQNRAESEAYIQGLGISADYWLRTAGSLQRILQGGE
ncbi:MAG TPA: hypothetical protein DEF72_07350 [Gammaproteobacteria bacterium]|nr:hypothetical protein [Gammaproteobacteria bacterium]